MSNPDHPLTGIRVLDLTQIYNGPYATFLMAMAGADVIKVEPPGGEHLRRRNARGGALYPFKMLNPNKRSILLDLKNKEEEIKASIGAMLKKNESLEDIDSKLVESRFNATDKELERKKVTFQNLKNAETDAKASIRKEQNNLTKYSANSNDVTQSPESKS